jgi:hypothetical protein
MGLVWTLFGDEVSHADLWAMSIVCLVMAAVFGSGTFGEKHAEHRQFERLKKRMRAAIDQWAGTQRKKFWVVDHRFETRIDKDLDQEVMTGVILKLSPVDDKTIVVPYHVSATHLGEDLEEWGTRLDQHLPHILKTMRHRTNMSREEGRPFASPTVTMSRSSLRIGGTT